MPAERSSHTPPDPDEIAQRAILLQLLRSDHDPMWSRPDLQAAIEDIPPADIDSALQYLHQQGLIHLSGGLVWASRAAKHLDNLGMIAI